MHDVGLSSSWKRLTVVVMEAGYYDCHISVSVKLFFSFMHLTWTELFQLKWPL